jgi:hypothetical protein
MAEISLCADSSAISRPVPDARCIAVSTDPNKQLVLKLLQLTSEMMSACIIPDQAQNDVEAGAQALASIARVTELTSSRILEGTVCPAEALKSTAQGPRTLTFNKQGDRKQSKPVFRPNSRRNMRRECRLLRVELQGNEKRQKHAGSEELVGTPKNQSNNSELELRIAKDPAPAGMQLIARRANRYPCNAIGPTNYEDPPLLARSDIDHPDYTTDCPEYDCNSAASDTARDRVWEIQKTAMIALQVRGSELDKICLHKICIPTLGVIPEYTSMLPHCVAPAAISESLKMKLIHCGCNGYLAGLKRWKQLFTLGFFLLRRFSYNKQRLIYEQSGKKEGNVSSEHLRHITKRHEDIDEHGTVYEYHAFYNSMKMAIESETLRLEPEKRLAFAYSAGYTFGLSSTYLTQPRLTRDDFTYETQPKNGRYRYVTKRSQEFLIADEANFERLGVSIGTPVVMYTMTTPLDT